MKILRPPLGSSKLSLSVTFLALFSLSPLFGQVSEQVGIDQPFAYWTMNESAPGAANNLGVSGLESAIFEDNGQLEFGVPGLADPNFPAVRFNGENNDGVGGFMNIANTTNSNEGGPWREKTIEFWFSVDDADSENEQVIYEQGGSTRGMSVYVRGGKLFMGAHNSNGDAGGVAAPWPAGALNAEENELAFVSTDIESNTPYHAVMVMQGDDAFDDDGILDGTITGYLNGEEIGVADQIGTLYAHGDGIRVGGVRGQTHFDLDFSGETPYGTDRPYFFKGVIDDVALYGTALSADRVKAHYDARDYVVGDFDGDGTVAFADFLVMGANFNQPGGFSQGDITFDGHVDLADFSQFRRVYAAAQGGAAASVPEPSAQWMILVCAFALPLLRRRTR